MLDASMFKLVEQIGFPAIIFIIWYLFWRGESRKWSMLLEQERAKMAVQMDRDEKDRGEHMEKWRTMISAQKDELERILKTHRDQVDQMFRLYDRQGELMVIQARHLQSIDAKIADNQFCPVVRANTKKEGT